jgi:para-aminobenzoate synthetase component 1
MLNWIKKFNIFCYLDNQQYSNKGYEFLVAVNAFRHIDDTSAFKEIDNFLSHNKTWSFGHLSYSLKSELLSLAPGKKDRIGFPHFFFFQPEILIILKNKRLIIHAKNPDDVFEELTGSDEFIEQKKNEINLRQGVSKEKYFSIIKQLQAHILRGDCYEINFCQEFFADDVSINPATIFQNLLKLSPTPYSAFYRLNDKYLISASPERFIKKTGNKIFSQPMKGTARRNIQDDFEDEQLKQILYFDEKERAENVMVVDLVRNDLSKICKDGTVKVDELFGVYSFPQVHQMVSTVSGELRDRISFFEIIKATFPMGSMTGAPKHRVMQLIEEYEPIGRGLFSGSVGYIDPDGDFDFNVVIRSILYNQATKLLSYYAGSGITFYSNIEKEWEECLLKAEAIKAVLTDSTDNRQ